MINEELEIYRIFRVDIYEIGDIMRILPLTILEDYSNGSRLRY